MLPQQTTHEQSSDPQQIGPYFIDRKIGEGSFGTIFKAYPSKQSSIPIAIKTESINNVKPMLLLQYQLYQELNKISCSGIPKAFDYAEKQVFNYMVMELLNITLDKYVIEKYGRNQKNLSNLPLDILLLIMNQTLKIIQNLHNYGYLYRDVKPANFMLKQPYDQLYLIDFGLCKKYMKNENHIPMKTGKKLVGTPLFCSRKTHAGLQQSRRDDIESWFFMSLYLMTELPWEQIINRKQLSKEQQYSLIGDKKQEVIWQKFIKENEKLPRCLLSIFNMVQKMQFSQRPNYEYMHCLISDEYRKLVGKDIPARIEWQSQIKKKDAQIKKIKINFKVPNSKLGKKTEQGKSEKKQFERQKENFAQ